jgi:GTP-binding protein
LILDRLPAEFVLSAAHLRDCPESVREVAFAGRSNAGKSSVLNALTGRRKLARTSKTPGRTRLLNFFHVAEGRHLVDLPGYGYARASRTEREQWQKGIEPYLARREPLAGLVLVMDVRHPLQPFDLQMLEWSRAAAMPVQLLLNKADKLSRGAALAAARKVERHALVERGRVVVQPFSALKRTGVDALIARLLELLELEVAGEGEPAPDDEGAGAAGA